MSKIVPILSARWQADADACDVCDALDGSYDWETEFPEGPPAHPNCKCELVYDVSATKTLDPSNKHWGQVLKSLHLQKNCGDGAGGFQPGNKCAGGGDGESSDKKPGDVSEVAGARGPVKVTHGPLEGKRFNDFDKDEPNSVIHPSDLENVKDKFGYKEQDDDYLYHVTTKDAANEMQYSGLTIGNKPNFAGYEAHSGNRAFLTERSGVKFWQGKVEDNLNATKDYNEGEDATDDIAVVRVARDKVRGTIQTDLEGTRDAPGTSYFVQGSNDKWESSGSLKDDLEYAESPEHVEAALAHHDAKKIEFDAPGVSPVWVTNDGKVVEWNGQDTDTSVSDVGEWIYAQNVEDYYPDYKQQFNDDFWSVGNGEVYHATPEENIDSILENGINASSETRGMSNANVGDAVYTTTEWEDALGGSYGDSIFAIDIGQMAKDGVKPWAEQEPAVTEYELRNALAYKLGIEDFHQDEESDMSPSTVVIDGNIPAKYIKLAHSPKLKTLRSDPVNKHWLPLLSLRKGYDPNEARADDGKWTDGGGSGGKDSIADYKTDVENRVKEINSDVKKVDSHLIPIRDAYEKLYHELSEKHGEDFDRETPAFVEARNKYNEASRERTLASDKLNDARKELDILNAAPKLSHPIDVTIKEGLNVHPAIAQALVNGVVTKPWGDESEWVSNRYRFELNNVRSGYGADTYQFNIVPKNRIEPVGDLPTIDEIPNRPGYVYRGMSAEEWENSMKSGKLQSTGTHNMEQEGLTFYGSARTAEHYSSGFAPFAFQTAPGRDGVVVEIPRDLVMNHKDDDRIPESEFAHKGSIPISAITNRYALRATEFKPGMVEAVYDNGKIREGSRYTPSAQHVVIPLTGDKPTSVEKTLERDPVNRHWLSLLSSRKTSGVAKTYDENEARDSDGKWTDGGGGSSEVGSPANPKVQAELETLAKPYGRHELPQIAGADKPEFLEGLKARGINYETVSVPTKQLKGIQAEYDAEKVGGIRDFIASGKAEFTPPLVSSDDYIVDGHHRWRGQYEADPKSNMDAIRVDLPVKDLIKEISDSPKSFTADVQQVGDIETQKAFSNLLKGIHQPDGGFTYQPVTEEVRKTGYSVSPYPERSFGKDVKDLRVIDLFNFVQKNGDLLAEPKHYFGAWHDPETGKVFLDVAIVTDTAKEVETLALKHDQIAYFDFQLGKSVTVNRNATSGGQASKAATYRGDLYTRTSLGRIDIINGHWPELLKTLRNEQ